MNIAEKHAKKLLKMYSSVTILTKNIEPVMFL